MKPDLRWQILLALAGFGLILTLLSFQVQSAGLCTERVPAAGGVFAEGMLGAPRALNPLLSDNYPVDRELVSLIFDGLTRYDAQGFLVPALAESWRVSDDGRFVRFSLRPDLTWHDGEPVTTADVAFTYGLLQDPETPAPAPLKALWQSVTIRVVDERLIDFELAEPYSPFLDATTRGLLPAHRLAGVTGATLAMADFNRAPIGAGPFMVEPGQDWQRTRRLRLLPNPVFYREGAQVANLEFRFYPDEAALLAAFTAGEIQAINSVAPTLLPAIVSLPDVRLFSAVAPRMTMLLFNQTETAVAAVRSLDVRRALAYALDRRALVAQALNGQGVLLDGPYLPTSWAYDPTALTIYASNPVSATLALEAAGWTLSADAAVRQRAGAPLTLRLLALDDPTHRALAEAIAAQWALVGVAPQVSFFSAGTDLRQALAARDFDVALVDVAPPGDPDLYDFWSQEAIVRGQNYAGWNRRRASEALESARQVWDVAERRPYYQTFLRLYDQDLPALTLYQHVYTYALSSVVNQAEIGRIDHPRERYATFADWFLLYRDVAVACPAPELGDRDT